MMLLEGRVVVVAGVGPGTGRAAAVRAAEEGASVVLAARTTTRLQEVAAAITSAGGRATCVPTDLSDPAQCEQLAGVAVDTFGRVDAVIHTAFARPATGPIRERAAAEWHDALDGNVLAAMHLARAFAPSLSDGRPGSLVLVSSISAREPYRESGIYATMKAAQLTLTKVLAQDLGRDGVRVNCIVPGYIDGPGLGAFFEVLAEQRGTTAAEARADEEAGTVLGRFVTPDEVANAALMLASDLASGITGQSLDVNGGQWFA
jgi:NAD(P)-dependent dehydrogenase (short-subunit alcohol dehydrogenase family)